MDREIRVIAFRGVHIEDIVIFSCSSMGNQMERRRGFLRAVVLEGRGMGPRWPERQYRDKAETVRNANSRFKNTKGKTSDDAQL